MRTDENGQVWYRVNERYGTYGDIFWAPSEALRPIMPVEITPINPEIEDKRIEVDVREKVQTLSCYEEGREVFFCRVSCGKRADAEGNLLEKSATPPGPHPTWRKLISIHMSGGASGVGWDLVGVAWTTFFASPGIAIHGTFWHNNFGGEYMSHGCVNALPKDAQWIFRWTQPYVNYETGDLTVSMPGGTIVDVVEA
jgi:lipoprotein-anchoring transpeptidase ErfK/SrfK